MAAPTTDPPLHTQPLAAGANAGRHGGSAPSSAGRARAASPAAAGKDAAQRLARAVDCMVFDPGDELLAVVAGALADLEDAP